MLKIQKKDAINRFKKWLVLKGYNEDDFKVKFDQSILINNRNYVFVKFKKIGEKTWLSGLAGGFYENDIINDLLFMSNFEPFNVDFLEEFQEFIALNGNTSYNIIYEKNQELQSYLYYKEWGSCLEICNKLIDFCSMPREINGAKMLQCIEKKEFLYASYLDKNTKYLLHKNKFEFSFMNVKSNVLFEMGKYDESLQVLDMMEKLSPNLPALCLRRADIYIKINEIDKAKEWLEKAHKIIWHYSDFNEYLLIYADLLALKKEYSKLALIQALATWYSKETFDLDANNELNGLKSKRKIESDLGNNLLFIPTEFNKEFSKTYLTHCEKNATDDEYNDAKINFNMMTR